MTSGRDYATNETNNLALIYRRVNHLIKMPVKSIFIVCHGTDERHS